MYQERGGGTFFKVGGGGGEPYLKLSGGGGDPFFKVEIFFPEEGVPSSIAWSLKVMQAVIVFKNCVKLGRTIKALIYMDM